LLVCWSGTVTIRAGLQALLYDQNRPPEYSPQRSSMSGSHIRTILS
jgi:hypothetical protein